MHSFQVIVAASAFIASVSSSPILSARATCGSTPSGSSSQSPISQPTGITTAQACQAQCDSNSSCQSFVFGMVDGVDKCMLFSVSAANVPKQSSTNLIVYDKACTSVPAVVPTAQNPTGAATSNQGANHKLAIRDTCGARHAPLSPPKLLLPQTLPVQTLAPPAPMAKLVQPAPTVQLAPTPEPTLLRVLRRATK
jgi:hypothetical protein